MDKLISVIVPVYNSEKYLPFCINSILCQTYSNIELILIDDGSTDSSGKICDEFANIDNRVRVIHKKNGGVSSARNLGIDEAKGEYIAFVDSDDFISENYLKAMYEKTLENEPTDVVFCKFAHFKKNTVIKVEENLPEFLLLDKQSREYRDFITRFFRFRDNIFGSSCRSLWNRNSIGDVRFNEKIKYSEDLLFVVSVLCNSAKFKSIDEHNYFYRLNDSSCTFSYKKDFISSQLTLISGVQKLINSQQLPNDPVFNSYFCLLVYYLFSNEIKFRKCGWNENIRSIRNSEIYKFFTLKNGMRIDGINSKIKVAIVWILVKMKVV